MTDDQPFVLDAVENPHPRMLAGALDARSKVLDPDDGFDHRTAFWQGYLAAMADATGCEPADLEAWMDRHT